MENGADGSDPSSFLTQIIGSTVRVKLNSGVEYTGMLPRLVAKWSQPSAKKEAGLLSSIDGYMNLAMEKTKEFASGSLRREYGDCFIRGNNGVHFVQVLAEFADHIFSHVYLCLVSLFFDEESRIPFDKGMSA